MLLEKADYVTGLQVYARPSLETVATSCLSSPFWTREEEIGLSSSLRVSIWKNFLILEWASTEFKKRKEKAGPFSEDTKPFRNQRLLPY